MQVLANVMLFSLRLTKGNALAAEVEMDCIILHYCWSKSKNSVLQKSNGDGIKTDNKISRYRKGTH